MTQHVRIVDSTKFHHAKRQWRIEVGKYTLLRLTYGQTGGALKTATAGDSWGRPVFPDPGRLIEAMAVSVESLAGPQVDLWLDEDAKGRQFLEFTAEASVNDFFEGAAFIAAEMAAILSRPAQLSSSSGRLACVNGALVAAA